ncbi:MAG: glycosyltransferase [Phycisphaerae bacterium]|nr:glycosyltransferase [Phycisphaerae bacterium]
MRVLILADGLFATHERGLLSRLEVGLADEGVRVVQATPEDVPASAAGLAEAITYPAGLWTLGTAWRARTIRSKVAGGGKVDIVHVFGGSAWKLGAMLAAVLESELVLEVWRLGLVARAAGRAWEDAIFMAPDPAIERSLLNEAQGLTVRLAAWGVLTPDEASKILAPARAPSVMVVGSGRDGAATRAALRGIAAAAERSPDLLVFVDAREARLSGLWDEARRLGMLDRLSLIEDLEGRRDLLLRADILVQPEALGEQRTTLLEAMGVGMAVVAARDPSNTALIDRRTAVVVDGHDAGAWGAAIAGLIGEPERARRLGAGAREYVREERPASAYVRAVLGAYQWATSADAIRFAE